MLNRTPEVLEVFFEPVKLDGGRFAFLFTLRFKRHVVTHPQGRHQLELALSGGVFDVSFENPVEAIVGTEGACHVDSRPNRLRFTVSPDPVTCLVDECVRIRIEVQDSGMGPGTVRFRFRASARQRYARVDESPDKNVQDFFVRIRLDLARNRWMDSPPILSLGTWRYAAAP